MKNLKSFVLKGIIFTIIAGTLLHFVYDVFGESALIGIFSPINESTWEHLKLIFYPMSLWFIYGFFKLGHNIDSYTTASIAGIISGMISVIVLFYTYTGIIGHNLLVMDILIFIISVCIGFFIFYFLTKNYTCAILSPLAGIIIIEFIFILFAYFTSFPPDINLFNSPV